MAITLPDTIADSTSDTTPATPTFRWDADIAMWRCSECAANGFTDWLTTTQLTSHASIWHAADSAADADDADTEPTCEECGDELGDGQAHATERGWILCADCCHHSGAATGIACCDAMREAL